MGNQQYSSIQASQSWEVVNDKKISIPGNPALVRSFQNKHLMGEKYTFDLHNHDECQSIYQFRKQKLKRIVGIYNYQSEEKCWGCVPNTRTFTIITEHIPSRLSNFQNLSFNQIAYILHESLLGYQYLKQKNYLCYPNANMIGIKDNAQIKVWINTNWSLNTYRKAKTEMSAVDELITLICNFSNDPHRKLLEELRTLSNLSFSKAIQELQRKFSHVFNDGRLSLERKMIHSSTSHTASRPRAFSEGSKKSITSIVYHNGQERVISSALNQPNKICSQEQKKIIKKPLSCNFNGKQYQNQPVYRNVKISPVENKYRPVEIKKPPQPIYQPVVHKNEEMIHLNIPQMKNSCKVSKNIGQVNTKKYLSFFYSNPDTTTSTPSSVYQTPIPSRMPPTNENHQIEVNPFPTAIFENELQETQKKQETHEEVIEKKDEQSPEINNLVEQFKYYLRSAKRNDKCEQLNISIITEEPLEFDSERNQNSHRNSVSKQTIIR